MRASAQTSSGFLTLAPFMAWIFAKVPMHIDWDSVKRFLRTFWFSIPYVLVILILAIVLIYVDQTREIYRTYAQDPSGHLSQIIVSALLLPLSTFMCLNIMRDSAAQYAADRNLGSVTTLYLDLFPYIAMIIPLAAAFGIYDAIAEDPVSLMRGWTEPGPSLGAASAAEVPPAP